MERYKSLFKEEFEFDKNYLVKKYKEFNKKYFDGDLSEYPIKIKTLKQVSGKVVSRGFRNDPTSWVIEEIVISDFTEFENEDHLLGILLHEMIHIKNIEDQVIEYGGMHGVHFTKELERLRRLAPFDIPVTEDMNNLRVSKKVKKTEMIVVVLKTMTSIATFDIKLKNNIVGDVKNFPTAWIEKFKPIIFTSDDLELNKYPKKRKATGKSVPFYQISKEESERLIKDGKIIYKF